MKNNLKLLSLLIFTVTAFAFACARNEISTESNRAATPEKQLYKSVGIVKNVDLPNEKITIDHEEIRGYMSPMEMTESVSDKTSLETLKTGDKVEFELERTGADLLITKLTKIGEDALVKSAEIYKTNCAECHGAKGEGAKKGIPLVSGHALHHSEAEFVAQVTDGEANKMPAFKDKLTTDEIRAVVRFVREEIQKDAEPSEKVPHKH